MPKSSTHPSTREVKLRIILIQPPQGADYALQQGHGSKFQLIQIQRSNGKDLRFDLTIEVRSKSNSQTFTGPFVQGPVDDRFVYISIGNFTGQSSPWSRRLKIPLSSITSKMIESAEVLESTIPGTAKDGSPSCAYAWRETTGPDWSWRVLR